jgi:uncharacterized lipoprotein YajG
VQTLLVLGLTVGVLTVAGCAGKGETRRVDLHTTSPAAQSADMEPVTIVIEPFEDRRVEQSRIGMRSHLWGGVTYFNVAGDKPGDAIARELADRLKTRGWRDRAWNVRFVQAGSATDGDIIITGQVQDLTANAKSRVFSTVIDTSCRFTIQARNLADKSTTMRSVEGAQSRTVFWFSEDDVQEVLAATLKDEIDRFIADTMIEQKALRMAR